MAFILCSTAEQLIMCFSVLNLFIFFMYNLQCILFQRFYCCNACVLIIYIFLDYINFLFFILKVQCFFFVCACTRESLDGAPKSKTTRVRGKTIFSDVASCHSETSALCQDYGDISITTVGRGQVTFFWGAKKPGCLGVR